MLQIASLGQKHIKTESTLQSKAIYHEPTNTKAIIQGHLGAGRTAVETQTHKIEGTHSRQQQLGAFKLPYKTILGRDHALLHEAETCHRVFHIPCGQHARLLLFHAGKESSRPSLSACMTALVSSLRNNFLW